jgi:Flp pilus assembly protein TadG
MEHRLAAIALWRIRRCGRDFLGDDGGVAVELGLLAGLFLMPLMLGIFQYGLLLNATQALAAATRIGAEYARQNPNDTTGIQNAITNSMNYGAGVLTFPPSFGQTTCYCDDGTTITCPNSCSNVGRPSPNRVFLTISANQTFTPFITLWTIPTTLKGVTDIRIQ